MMAILVLFSLGYQSAISMFLTLNIFLLLFQDINFLVLDRNMKKYHNYEYKRTKRAMWSQFVLINCVFAFNFTYYNVLY